MKFGLASTILLGTSMLFILPARGQATTAPAPTQQQPAQPNENADGLEEIVVKGRFLATGASSATKLNVSTLDTPFSVSAYTGDFMKAIQTVQVADLYRY